LHLKPNLLPARVTYHNRHLLTDQLYIYKLQRYIADCYVKRFGKGTHDVVNITVNTVLIYLRKLNASKWF